jgi:nucleotide-binding universal stress UspA family protein
VAGVDGSAVALHAVRWAAREAAALGVPLRLVHSYFLVIGDYSKLQITAADVQSEMRAAGAVRLQDAENAALDTEPTLRVESALYEGDPRVVLLGESRHAALVVLGSRGLNETGRLLLGSSGLTVAVQGDCPLVVVRAKAPECGPVLVGVDGWPGSAAAARFAFQQASMHGCALTVLHTWTELTAAGVPWASDGGSDVVHEEQRRLIVERLSGLTKEFVDVPVEYVVVRGRPGRALLQYGEHARLIVVGTRGRSAFTGLLLGSVSQNVANHALCPVAVVRSKADTAHRSPPSRDSGAAVPRRT